MGKKSRRTRWRTLTITDEHSDSEESNTTTSGHRVPKGYQQKSYYNRFMYSSQSTPTRRYQYDNSTKSTRSSSTASENKITFNEDEYTRITTPRQDVLFKKGYLNKPKTYQTQTSTGNSTTSTGNSTGNGTPDHQSTDLEYESQFVFPNGFIDQNGIYYVNSFEPYPLMVYNPPTYFPEYTNIKSKRCSTGSLTESTSPNPEEASQEPSPNEDTNPSINNSSDANPVYNIIYPPFYYNSACQTQEIVNESEPRRLKRRRRRKLSQEGTTSESSSADEVFSGEEELNEEEKEESDEKPKYDLKPDAEEFIPRAYRQQETIPMETNVQYIKIPSNFVPVPIINPMGEFNAFIPPGIPINFIPQNYVSYVPFNKPVSNEIQQENEEKDNVNNKENDKKKEDIKETVEVPKNQIDIAKIVSKLEEAAKEQQQDEKTVIKEEKIKKRKFQKVDLKKSLPQEILTPKSSPKKEEIAIVKPMRNYSETLKKAVAQTNEKIDKNINEKKINKTSIKQSRINRKEEIVKVTNEWISVSSRKKRKNKNVEESEDFVEVEVEVAPPEVEKIEEKQEQKVEVVGTVESIETPLPQDDLQEEKKNKKPKKNNPKETKRVIITDVDLTENVKVEEEKKEEMVKEEVKVEEPPVVERKSKKKKKKPAVMIKSPILNSQSSSNTTLNITDDSYDFLLDESLEKTNIEVSQELDKMIQRGMYNSLEEKIKSMNIESNENFFKTIINNISSNNVVDNNNPLINSNLTKLIKVIPPTKSDDFLSESTTLESIESGEDADDPYQDDNLYPITKAVKEWVTKTRETTPDVEIFKSPSTILREFGCDDEDEDEVTIYESNEVEPYDSKYGKNEDFLKIQQEVNELKNNYPKHGNLPYRAICCSIM